MPILNPPLRVMHIISGDLWAGAEVQAFTLLQQLHMDGVELQVIIMNDGELFHRLQSIKVPTILIDESATSSLAIIKKYIGLIRAFKPNIIHTHRQKENIFGNIANYLAQLPITKRAISVRTTHGAPEFTPTGKQKLQLWLDNWVGRHLQQAIIAVSSDLAEKLTNTFTARKIHTIRNGVDQAMLLAQAKTANFRTQHPNYTHIGIIGRIEQVKRIDIFIDMAAILIRANNIKPLKFHVIGEGSLKTAMELKSQELGLQEHISFHGHRQDMASCIKSLDLIVMCSDHEGTPMTALEALALGTPLIAHNTGGLKDILQGYPNLLVSNHTAQGYADKVANTIASDAKIFVEIDMRYTAAHNKQCTLDMYAHLLQIT